MSVFCKRQSTLRKKTMNLCACDSEEREHGVGTGVNATILSENTSSHKPRRIFRKGVSVVKKKHEPVHVITRIVIMGWVPVRGVQIR